MKAREALHSESQIFHEDNRFRSSTTFFFSFRRYLTPKDVVVMHETFEQDDIMNLIRLGATPSVFDRVGSLLACSFLLLTPLIVCRFLL
jgi:hypothetical protein